MALYRKTICSPIGELTLVANDNGLEAILWENDDSHRVHNQNHPILSESERQLHAYFAGKLKKFTIPLDLKATQFRLLVWSKLLGIPFGETCSYGEIAGRIGKPTASRAVGGAIGANNIPIIIPCHRVIGSKGNLTGFAGGIENKKYLLQLENKYC